MTLARVIPFVLGTCIVLQGAINRRLTMHWGLSQVVLLNCTVVIVLAASAYGAMRWWSGHDLSVADPSEFYLSTAHWRDLQWWWLLPGLCGFLLVLGAPYAITRIGALRVYIGVVTAQMIVSMVWDGYVEKVPTSPARIAGAALMIIGVWLTAKR